MTSIRNTLFNELKIIFEMSYQSHINNNLNYKTLEAHEQEFRRKNIIYLSIINSAHLFTGYFIIKKESNSNNVQLKRVLIDEKHLGIGQEAILLLENLCIKEFKSSRIWLDVYETNKKAIHIYEKLGYKKFKESIEYSRPVLFYEKML